MMEKSKLRGADVVTAALLILFGLWMLSETFRMPMKDSFGGVMNVWYVSPALLPMIIGGGIILLAVNILIHGLRNDGGKVLTAALREKRAKGFSEGSLRFFAILLPLIGLVYMNLPRIDFFLCLALFLTFFVTVFYLDDPVLLKKFLKFHFGQMVFLFILFLSGLDKILNGLMTYSVDIIAIALLAVLIIRMRRSLRGSPDYIRKFRHAMTVAFLTPLVLVPVFRFFLRVPLPKEGGIVDLMYILYYAVR